MKNKSLIVVGAAFPCVCFEGKVVCENVCAGVIRSVFVISHSHCFLSLLICVSNVSFFQEQRMLWESRKVLSSVI